MTQAPIAGWVNLPQNNDNSTQKKRAPKLPSDFENEEDFLGHIRKLYSDDVGADQENRREALLDAKFVAGKQWDETVYQRRISKNKPALTVNLLPAFMAQVVNSWRLNETVIKIIPDHGGDKKTAEVREGIIRDIQKQSNAKRAFDAAFQNCVIGGLGNFQVCLDYTSDDVFEQEIKIDAIYDDQAVAWDRGSVDPTGADARHVIVTERMSKAEFEKAYPDANASDFASDEPNYAQLYADGWFDANTVRIADFWRVRSRKRTLALLTDNTTRDVTDMEPEELAQLVATKVDGTPIMRETRVKYAEMYRVSGSSVLEGPYRLPIKRVPVFRVPGWEISTGTYRTRFGLIRWMRDPQRFHNYWLSVLTEKLMLTPRAKWLIGKTAGQGYEDSFRRSHLSDDPALFWNDEAANKPEIIQPAQLEPALLQQIDFSSQMLKDVSNLHEASLGQTSNEVSGKAIMARQRVGETGTLIYQDNMKAAQEEAGRVINDLISFVYDTPRVVKVLGTDEDFDYEFVKVNYPDDPASVDLTIGKYHVTVTTGPSFATKRIENAEFMMAAVNANPALLEVAGDLILEAQDVASAKKIAERIRSRMSPDLLGDDITPEQQEQMAAQAAQQQEVAAIAKEKELAEIDYKRAQAEEARARAQAATAAIARDDVKAEADIEERSAKVESMRTKDQLQTIDALTGENNV